MRRCLILRQLAQEQDAHELSSLELDELVEATKGRSAVNLTRLISSAAANAQGLPVTRDDFDVALKVEPSDYNHTVAKKLHNWDKKHGWRGM